MLQRLEMLTFACFYVALFKYLEKVLGQINLDKESLYCYTYEGDVTIM